MRTRGIPPVKLWRVTFTDGASIQVYAPTHRLALLNVRIGEAMWGPIRSIGVIRSRRAWN